MNIQCRIAKLERQIASLQARALAAPPPDRPADRLLAAIAAHYSITPEQLLSRARWARLARARMVAYRLLRDRLQWSRAEVAAYMLRHPSAVTHGLRTLAADAAHDPRLAAEIAALLNLDIVT